MKRTRKALLSSIIALVLCFSMLLGTTWAWFTDEVTSAGNIIQSGTLKAEMFWSDTGAEGTFNDASQGAIFNYQHWEPGFTQIKYVKVENTGNLAFRYMLNIIPSTLPVAGEANLADVIDVYMLPAAAGRDDIAAATPVGTLSQLMAAAGGAVNGVLLPTSGSAKYDDILAKEANAQTGNTTYCVALKMQEAAGNEYQNKTVNGSFAVQLLASQYTYENDSFGNDYDGNSQYAGVIDFTTSVEVATDDTGALAEAVTIGDEGEISAAVPAGVKMAEGAAALALSVKTMNSTEANVHLGNGETMQSLDIHVEGVAEDNTVPMQITLPGRLKTGLNSTSVEMYHVEDGETVEMELVASLGELDEHNEFYYDPATGDVTISTATFSEFVTIEDVVNLWEGTDAPGFNSGSGEAEDPYIIANAEQLAYFRNQVDAGETYAGKFVKLNGDIDLSGKLFDPIGCGYAPETGVSNSNNVTGTAFSGIFDGQGHTISGLYQDGWDLGLEYCNLGGGLFASIADGTVKNLTISGADIKMECVEMGVLVGLSQGDCTYDNIKIYDSKIANYQRATGGLIGEVSPLNGGGTTTITNVTIGSDVVVGSLWGDFDAPVGGVIGARWDDGNTTEVVMDSVTVAARLDVYNDVTSTYEWYAYRRAGMLIGNTDTPSADGKNSKIATADFLTCSNVTVKYGPWVNYHYCEFSNYNSSWPWVRVEAGENCEAYSNPRYGVPNDINGKKVTNAHTKNDHADGDGHNLEIPFGQLYGGGQGVYGGGQTEDYESTHDGVTIEIYDYSVTYMDRGEVFAVDYVDNETNYTIKHTTYEPTRTGTTFKEWVNAGGTRAADIEAGNTENITVYDSWHGVYTARFLDQKGNVIYEEEFNTSQSKVVNEPDVPEVEGLVVVGWEDYNLKEATRDIAIKPVYKINDYVQLNPVDSNNDGVTDYYEVVGSNIPANNTDIVIPEEVNGIKVTEIVTGAFENGGLRDVHVPNSIEKIGKNAFCKDDDGGFLDSGEFPQIQIIFDGTKAEWDVLTKDDGWDDNIGTGSVIICTQEPGGGYYKQNGSNGFWGSGIKIDWEWISGSFPDWYPRS